MKKKKSASKKDALFIRKTERPCTSRADWSRYLQNELHHYRQELKKRGNNLASMLDFTSEMQKRRTEAVLDYIDEIQTRYRKLFEYDVSGNDLGREWIWLNLPAKTYSAIEASDYILFAAAIWILDRIEGFEARTALCRLLTRDETDLDNIDSPPVWDCQHDEFLILSVVHLLYERNADLGKVETDMIGRRKVLTNSLAAGGNTTVECGSRARFDALLSMLPEEDMSNAAARFRKLFWAWTDRYIRSIRPFLEQIAAEEDETEKLDKEYNEKRRAFFDILNKAELDRNRAKEQRRPPAKGSPLKPAAVPSLPMLPAVGAFSDPAMRFQPMSDLERQSRDLAQQLDDLTEKLEQKSEYIESLIRKLQRLQHEMTHYGRPIRSEIEEEFGPEVAAEINDLPIGDPYELCFALLFLIESGDDLPWLYGPGVGLMTEVAESLPWGVYSYEEEEDQIWFPDEDYEPGPVKPSAIPDWYERKYLYRKGKEDAFPRSLAQIVYERTGCLMPRDMHLYDAAVKELGGYGIRGKDATGLLYCMLALANARHQDNPLNLEADMQMFLDDEGALQAENKTKLSYDELKEKAEQQKKEIHSLRKALHEAERSARTVGKELENLRKSSESEHRELADLRDYLFYQNAEIEEEEEAGAEDSFPYKVQNETLVFGGHATWLKAIKPLLTGSIRFIDKNKGFDNAIIRHADIVWIQPNALSHSQYYTIIDAVRQLKKPVRYFTYASALKCARQLCLADQEKDI